MLCICACTHATVFSEPRCGGPCAQDVLLSWVAVVMLALEIVGVPLLPEVRDLANGSHVWHSPAWLPRPACSHLGTRRGRPCAERRRARPRVQGEERLRRKAQEGAAAEDNSRMSVGLKAFVKMAVDQFLAGTDLYRLQLQQSMAGACLWGACGVECQCGSSRHASPLPHLAAWDPLPHRLPAGDQAGEGGLSPSVRLMQQNTRLGAAPPQRLACALPLLKPPSRCRQPFSPWLSEQCALIANLLVLQSSSLWRL